MPSIARATALAALADYLSLASIDAVRAGLRSADTPLLQLGALDALTALDPRWRLPLAAPLLKHPLLAVRSQAARTLAPLRSAQLPPGLRAAFANALEDYIATQHANAERPEAWLNLGGLYAERGRFDRAQAAFRQALALQPASVPAAVNLADLYRAQNRDAEAEAVLRRALTVTPDAAAAHHALGLALVRRRQSGEARDALARAAELAPSNARYQHVYAVALNAAGRSAAAIAVLEAAHRRRPGNTDIVYALATFHHDRGELDRARHYTQKLIALAPQHPAARQLIEQFSP